MMRLLETNRKTVPRSSGAGLTYGRWEGTLVGQHTPGPDAHLPAQRTMSLSFLRLALLVLAVAFGAPPADAHAQQRDSIVSAATMESFAKAHLAVATLRSHVQAELAKTSSKKREAQAALRDQLQIDVQRLLKEHGITESEFARITRQISTDVVVRRLFEETVLRLSGGKGAG